MVMLKNFLAACIGLLVGTAAMAATQWGQTHEVRDVLRCRASQVFAIKNAEGSVFRGDSLEIVQNSNRNYATLRLNGKTAGLASYGRSRAGQVITVRGWDVKFAVSLRPVGGQTLKNYSAQSGDLLMGCVFGRANFEL